MGRILRHIAGAAEIRREFSLVEVGVMALALAAMHLSTHHYSYLLFHSIVEMFSIFIAITVFIIVVNTAHLVKNEYIIVIGVSYLFVGVLDFVHTIAFKGMPIFTDYDYYAPQLWIAARYMESISMLGAFLFLGSRRRFNIALLSVVYFAVTATVLASILHYKTFPICFVPGKGLTSFKMYSEFVICGIVAVGLTVLYLRRHLFDPRVYRLISTSMVLMIAMELCFTFYMSATMSDVFNEIGHLLKICVFYLVYKAVVVTGLRDPIGLLFRDLKAREESLGTANARLADVADEMLASRSRLKAITDSLFEGVLVVDGAGIITFSNPSAARMLECGADRRDLEGVAIDQVAQLAPVGGETVPAGRSWWCSAADGRTQRWDDARLVVQSGGELDVAVACSPLEGDGASRDTVISFRDMGDGDDGRGPSASVISFRDIGAVKQAQREALQTSRLASVGQLAAGIAHEINTPAQYISDNLGYIEDGLGTLCAVVQAGGAATDKKIARLLQEMPQAVAESREGVAQIARIVLSMKEFSHPGTTTKTATDINRAIDNTLTVSRNAWKHVTEVECRFDPMLPPVQCHTGEMNQVFLNLILNAAQAIESSGKQLPGRIVITTSHCSDQVEIRIEDSGTGIPASIRERIFDPFFTTKAVGKGTGQGLAICRDVVVVKHGGSLTVGGVEGEGAVFTVRLPIDGGHDAAVET